MFIMYFGTLFQMFFQIKKNRVVNQTSRRQMALSNSGMIKKMMNLPLRFFEQYSVGELMGRLDSNEKLEDSIMNSLIPRMINTFMTIFYFFMIRPQTKRQKEIKKFQDSLENGKTVITQGGIYGRVREVKDNYVLVEIADGVKIRVNKNMVFDSPEDASQQPTK